MAPETERNLEDKESAEDGEYEKEIEEKEGSLATSPERDKLLHSALAEEKVKKGKLISAGMNQAVNSFIPSMFFEKITTNYKTAEKLYGETMIRELTGYEPDYVKKNLKIPEFREEMKSNIKQRIDSLKKEDYLDKDGKPSEKGVELAALVMYSEELDNLVSKGLGKKEVKKTSHYGEKEEYEEYKKQRYRDLAIKKSVKTALRRGHKKLRKEDLKAHTREERGSISIIYALDSSGSMRGKKIETAKKAGIALAYKATEEKNKIGLITFTSEVQEALPPGEDFKKLLRTLVTATAKRETNIAKTILKSTEMFKKTKGTKHLLLLTDAVPTKGEEPREETIKAVSQAKSSDVTISVVGIDLEEEGAELAEQITKIGEGKLYRVKDVENLDKIILEDYYSIR